MLMTYSTVCCVAQSYWFYLKKINRSLLVGLRQILAAGGSFAGLLAAAALHFWHDDDEGPCAIRFHVAFGVILPPLSPCSCQLLLRRRAIYPALQGVKYFANAVECTWNKGRDTAPTWPPVCFHVTRQKLNCTWHRWWDGKDLGGAIAGRHLPSTTRTSQSLQLQSLDKMSEYFNRPTANCTWPLSTTCMDLLA